MERRKVSSGEFHRGISQSSNVPLVHQVMKVLAMDVFRHASLLLVAAIAKDERGGGQCFPREKYSGWRGVGSCGTRDSSTTREHSETARCRFTPVIVPTS